MSTKALVLLAFHPPTNLNNRRTMAALLRDLRHRYAEMAVNPNTDLITLRQLHRAMDVVNGRLLTLSGRGAA